VHKTGKRFPKRLVDLVAHLNLCSVPRHVEAVWRVEVDGRDEPGGERVLSRGWRATVSDSESQCSPLT
jgi:hypothetical protein